MTSVLTGRRTAWLVALIPLLFAGALIGLLGEAEPRRLADGRAAAGGGQHPGHRAARPAADRAGRVGGDRAVQLGRSKISPAALASLEDTATGLGPQVRPVPSEDGTAALAVVPVTPPARPTSPPR